MVSNEIRPWPEQAHLICPHSQERETPRHHFQPNYSKFSLKLNRQCEFDKLSNLLIFKSFLSIHPHRSILIRVLFILEVYNITREGFFYYLCYLKTFGSPRNKDETEGSAPGALAP